MEEINSKKELTKKMHEERSSLGTLIHMHESIEYIDQVVKNFSKRSSTRERAIDSWWLFYRVDEKFHFGININFKNKYISVILRTLRNGLTDILSNSAPIPISYKNLEIILNAIVCRFTIFEANNVLKKFKKNQINPFDMMQILNDLIIKNTEDTDISINNNALELSKAFEINKDGIAVGKEMVDKEIK